MDIHSFLSPTLFIIVVLTVIVRSCNDDEKSITELGITFILGSIILLFICILLPIMFFIIFNNKLTQVFDPGARGTILIVQYYYTIFYYLTILYTTFIFKD